jgi:thiamine-phosphate pyrophosphorylase
MVKVLRRAYSSDPMVDKGPALPRGLYVLIDDSLLPAPQLAQAARQVLEGGARVLQLRLKQLADRPALELAREVVALARPLNARVLINDRVDLALLSGADGVHLGDDDLPVAQARRVLGPTALIGATTRSLSEIEQAAAAGADHVGLGPIFSTRTKQVPHPELGVVALARIAERSPLPIVAIAGIGLENIAPVARAGAHCAAVASALLNAGDLTARTRALQSAFLEGGQFRSGL